MLREAARLARLVLQPLATLDRVRRVQEPSCLVERVDGDDLRVEDVPDPIADRVVDRLQVELARQSVLHRVDQRQLRVSLPRLVHEPRVLERHAQAGGECLEELLVGFREGVLAVHVLQGDETCHPTPG